ncbi:proprotein convertase P-domain-containing protein [Luminiphilus sp.]|nr:proprotein convertase P-domain-containing protein [Luminiphilus sp.]
MKLSLQPLMPRIRTSILRPFAVTCLVAVTSLGWTGWAAAAACSSTNYSLKTQAEVDALGATGCDSVAGDLQISNSTDITNLDGLANITSVGDLLNISNNDSLTTLDGLANIISVGGGLSILGNDALTNLDGLANITSVGGDLSIGGNAALTNLDGLANITSVGDLLNISNNDSLTTLDGLANISSVGGWLQIYNNAALTNLDGLASLASVGSYLEIYQNYNASCEGVAQLLGWPNGPPDDTVAGNIDIGINGTGCNSIAEILTSVSGPIKPAITSASAISSGIDLEFSPSTTTDTLFPITGYEAACIGSSADLSEAPSAALLDNMPVTRTLTVSGYDPVSVLSDIEVDVDITHSDPTDLYITLTTPQGTELVLWDQGNSGGEDIAGTFPTTLTPIDTISSVGRQAMDGDWVLRVEDVDVGPLVREGVLNAWGLRISETVITAGSGSPITVNGVTRGRDYSCTVAPVTGLGTLPVSDAVTVNVPLELPATPTVTSTDYEDGTIRLTVSVADNGGADITEYSASCTDGTSTFTGTSSTPTIEVTGLTNGTAYTCSASATNAVGSSGASASTDSITPEALPTGLPIWLLYEATK